MNRDQLIKNFTTSFKKGSTYSSQEIKHFLNNIGSNYNSQNPVAFSYNQWNAGMQNILPLFVYEGRGKHKFLGPDVNYEGYALHRPKGNRKGFIKIGVWKGNNTFEYIDKNMKSFADWKQRLKGI